MEEVKAGSLNLPIGFRFHPTDEELLVHYLSRKIFSMPLPASIIPQVVDVFGSFPCDLPAGDLREKMYFFCKTNGDINSNGRNCCGYWKAVGQNQLIVVPISHHQQRLLIGTKKALRFHHSGCVRSRWFMHQYSLVTINNGTSQNANMTSQWSIFCIFQKKSVTSKNGKVVAEQCSIRKKRPLDQDQSDPASPSSNSAVTHISSYQSLELDEVVTSF